MGKKRCTAAHRAAVSVAEATTAGPVASVPTGPLVSPSVSAPNSCLHSSESVRTCEALRESPLQAARKRATRLRSSGAADAARARASAATTAQPASRGAQRSHAHGRRTAWLCMHRARRRRRPAVRCRQPRRERPKHELHRIVQRATTGLCSCCWLGSVDAFVTPYVSASADYALSVEQ